MRLANFKYEYGDQVPMDKWLFSFEIKKCSPMEINVFRPYIEIVCMKIIDVGEEYKIDGRPMKKKGGYWHWSCPFGIVFEIV